MSKNNPIREYRKNAGLSQAKFGELFGVLPPAVSKWESNRVSTDYVLMVHKATGIPLHKLRPDLYEPEEVK